MEEVIYLGFTKDLANISITIVTSIVLIFLGVLYFMLSMWIIKMGASWAGFQAVEGNWIVLTSGIVTAAAIIGSAIQK
ncbi:MAG: hypothetical protein ACQESF_03950 [Nanobdellota archaeon]